MVDTKFILEQIKANCEFYHDRIENGFDSDKYCDYYAFASGTGKAVIGLIEGAVDYYLKEIEEHEQSKTVHV